MTNTVPSFSSIIETQATTRPITKAQLRCCPTNSDCNSPASDSCCYSCCLADAVSGNKGGAARSMDSYWLVGTEWRQANKRGDVVVAVAVVIVVRP